MTNEFDNIEEEFEPQGTLPETNDNLVQGGQAGQVYDWNTAPSGSAMPKRKDLDGQEVVITNAELILPPKSKAWTKPFKGKISYKAVPLKITYNDGDQVENYSGAKVFPAGDDGEHYSHPTIQKENEKMTRISQATALLSAYAKFKGKNVQAVTLKEFMAFLCQKPKAVIKAVEVTNPDTGEKFMKNLVGHFI